MAQRQRSVVESHNGDPYRVPGSVTTTVIDFAAEGEDFRDVIRRLHRPRPYLVLTLAKRTARNAVIRVLGGRVGPALLRRAVALRNRLRGW